MTTKQWIWQQDSWPNLTWSEVAVGPLLRETAKLQGTLLGKTGAIPQKGNAESNLDALLQNIVETSAIEGENLNPESVRSSLAKRLGVKVAGLTPATAQTDGLAELLLDATQNYRQPLTLKRLLQWHCLLFPDTDKDVFTLSTVKVGELRGDEPMQVVSGPHNKRKLHFEAPPRKGLEQQLSQFLNWLTESANDPSLDPTLRAALAHLWFVTLHPFDDGNGRLARAISDYALAQAEHRAIRFYAMAATIMEKRNSYYEVLEATQKSGTDVTAWMLWFLDTFKQTLETALNRIEWVLAKARFWQTHAEDGLTPQQTKVLNRLMDAGPNGFEGGITASKYMNLAKVSKATATRHLQELLQKNCIVKRSGGGRSTSYDINWAT